MTVHQLRCTGSFFFTLFKVFLWTGRTINNPMRETELHFYWGRRQMASIKSLYTSSTRDPLWHPHCIKMFIIGIKKVISKMTQWAMWLYWGSLHWWQYSLFSGNDWTLRKRRKDGFGVHCRFFRRILIRKGGISFIGAFSIYISLSCLFSGLNFISESRE